MLKRGGGGGRNSHLPLHGRDGRRRAVDGTRKLVRREPVRPPLPPLRIVSGGETEGAVEVPPHLPRAEGVEQRGDGGGERSQSEGDGPGRLREHGSLELALQEEEGEVGREGDEEGEEDEGGRAGGAGLLVVAQGDGAGEVADAVADRVGGRVKVQADAGVLVVEGGRVLLAVMGEVMVVAAVVVVVMMVMVGAMVKVGGEAGLPEEVVRF